MRVPEGYRLKLVNPEGEELATFDLTGRETSGVLSRAIIFYDLETAIERDRLKR